MQSQFLILVTEKWNLNFHILKCKEGCFHAIPDQNKMHDLKQNMLQLYTKDPVILNRGIFLVTEVTNI